MNIIDRSFYGLAAEIRALGEKELYYRIRRGFDAVPAETQRSCADFFNRFGYWGRLEPERGIYDEIELKELALFEHLDEYVWLYEQLADYRSKKPLYGILNNWYAYDFKTTTQTKEELYDDYFDLDLVHCGPDEVITLKHTAYSRNIFANGAINAAVYLAKKEPGLYNMGDMIAAL